MDFNFSLIDGGLAVLLVIVVIWAALKLVTRLIVGGWSARAAGVVVVSRRECSSGRAPAPGAISWIRSADWFVGRGPPLCASSATLSQGHNINHATLIRRKGVNVGRRQGRSWIWKSSPSVRADSCKPRRRSLFANKTNNSKRSIC
ncbi:MAG: hypothetical protein IPG56_03930 [Caulobacteraceae bacterium]|nr:hypothetical protein [Caulobacteraceae bacterium]